MFLASAACAAESALPYTLRWKRHTGSPPPAAVVDGGDLTFFAEPDGAILAVDRVEGRRRWRVRPGGPIGEGLIVGADRVFAADRWGGVWALSAESGQILWSFRRDGPGSAFLRIEADGVLLAGGDGVLYRLDGETGAETWRVRTALRPTAAPALSGRRIFVATADHDLLALEARSGRRLVVQPLPEGARHVQADTAGAVWVAGDGAVRRYSSDLQPVWRRWLGTQLTVPPQMVAGGVLCAGDNGFLYLLHRDTGETIWKRALGSPVSGTPALTDPQGGLAVLTRAGRFLGLEPRGATAWERHWSGPTGRVRAAHDGRIYLSAGAHLHAFDAAVASDPGDTLWWTSATDGVKSGYGWQVWTESDSALRLDSYAVGWRSGFVQLRGSLVLEPHDLSLRRLERRRVEGSQALETALLVAGDSVHVRRRLGDSRQAWALPFVAGATVADAVPRWLRRRGLRPGAADSLLVVDPDHGATRPLTVTADGVDADTGQRRYRLRYGGEITPPPPAAADLSADLTPLLEVLLWVDGSGAEARTAVPALGALERRAGPREARDWTPAAPGRGLRLDASVERPDQLDSLVLRLPAGLGEASSLFVADARQSLRTDSAGTHLVVRRQVPPRTPAPIADLRRPDLVPYLQPSLHIQSAAAPIRRLARRIVPDPDAVDSWEATLALHDWVYDHMVPSETNVRFKSSTEVLEDLRGTCSEYTVLFAALARAVGIPTRVTVGYAVAADGRLVLHIWPQVFVGDWVEVDPSWNAPTVAASHVKTGQGLLHPAHLERLNLPLEWIAARADTLHLEAYGSGGAPFLARAEALYAEADAAERHFEEAAALAARYELAALTWNRRSGDALIEIARAHIQGGAWDDATWALDRIRHLDPAGPHVDDAIYYQARLEAARDRPAAGRQLLEELLRRYPEGDYAEDGLARLAELVSKAEGCRRARPLYERLREVYAESGWASVATAALRHCDEQELLLEEDAAP